MPIYRGIAYAVLFAGLNLQAASKVTVPPAKVRKALQLDAFYQKHVDVGGFSVVSSKKVSDYALLEAAFFWPLPLPFWPLPLVSTSGESSRYWHCRSQTTLAQ